MGEALLKIEEYLLAKKKKDDANKDSGTNDIQ
jgi:hypothetical protein